MIDFACRECGRYFRVSDDKAGLKGTCPDCGAPVVVPALDNDIVFSQPSIQERNTLNFELRDIYQVLLAYREQLNLCGTLVAEDSNIFFATFCVDEKRRHVTNAIQLESGGPVSCFTTIGDATKLSKQQIIEVLKRFYYNGILFSVGINDEDELVAQSFFKEPPVEPATVCSSMLSLAKFADSIEQEFFGVDLN